MEFLTVGLGGAFGSMLRYAVSLIAASSGTSLSPLATLAANVTGSLLIGVVLGLGGRAAIGEARFQLLVPGFLGGFTTFSAFSGEVVRYGSDGAFGSAVALVLASIFFGIGACALGFIVGRTFAG